MCVRYAKRGENFNQGNNPAQLQPLSRNNQVPSFPQDQQQNSPEKSPSFLSTQQEKLIKQQSLNLPIHTNQQLGQMAVAVNRRGVETIKQMTSEDILNSQSQSCSNIVYPEYIPMSKCPPRLSDDFKKHMHNLTMINEMEDHALKVCEETLRKIKDGVKLPKMPVFTVKTRPVIADGSKGTVTSRIKIIRIYKHREAKTGNESCAEVESWDFLSSASSGSSRWIHFAVVSLLIISVSNW